MKLFLTGLNHRTAPVEVRERLAFEQNRLPEALGTLKKHPGLLEGMILSTCNRVEITVAAEESAGADAVEQFLAECAQRGPRVGLAVSLSPRRSGRDPPSVPRGVEPGFDDRGRAADSGPVEERLRDRQGMRGHFSGFLDLVLTRAFNVAKRVRSETDIGESAVSVSYAAVELAREIFGSLDGKRVLVVGAGKMSESAARHLRRAGVSEILVTNRTRERADRDGRRIPGPRDRLRKLFANACRTWIS